MKIDICSICMNESLLLPSWIESWLSLPFINKLYIIDGGSTDNSVEICKGYDKVQVLYVPWKNDFSKQRNIAIKMAKSDWILQADIDEIPCANLNDESLFKCLQRKDINQIALPYIKFYDLSTLWFFNNENTPKLKNSDLIEFGHKSTITIFKKGHLAGYSKTLHEMPILSGDAKAMGLYYSSKFDGLNQKFLIGHYDQAKHVIQASKNKTTLEYEMGLKRARYRLISDATYEGKTYTREWAEKALHGNNMNEIESLGKAQLKSFLNEHTVLKNYNAFDLNNDIVKRKLGNV